MKMVSMGEAGVPGCGWWGFSRKPMGCSEKACVRPLKRKGLGWGVSTRKGNSEATESRQLGTEWGWVGEQRQFSCPSQAAPTQTASVEGSSRAAGGHCSGPEH